jgi:TolB-like protein
LVLAGLLAAGPGAAPKQIKVAVSEVEAGPSVDPKLAHFVTTLVTSELRRRPNLAVTSQEDVKNLLGFDRQKALLGCVETSCLAEIGGALGVEQIVTGSMAKIGDSIVLVLRAVDVRHGAVLRDVSRRLRRASQDALLDALPAAVAQLYPLGAQGASQGGPQAPGIAVETAAAPAAHRSTAPWWLAGAGGVVALTGGALWLGAAHAGQSNTSAAGTTYSISWAQAQKDNAVGYIGQGAVIVGVAALAAGIIWGVWPSPESAEAAP